MANYNCGKAMHAEDCDCYVSSNLSSNDTRALEVALPRDMEHEQLLAEHEALVTTFRQVRDQGDAATAALDVTKGALEEIVDIAKHPADDPVAWVFETRASASQALAALRSGVAPGEAPAVGQLWQSTLTGFVFEIVRTNADGVFLHPAPGQNCPAIKDEFFPFPLEYPRWVYYGKKSTVPAAPADQRRPAREVAVQAMAICGLTAENRPNVRQAIEHLIEADRRGTR